MTRNAFEKHFFPENLNLKDCVEHLPVPPSAVSTPIKLTKCTISGPTIFVAGRYRKLSRELSQSPWILGGKRVMDESVQEIIAREIAPYFSVDPVSQVEQINFMSSGREDIDVRCLGKGRPFVLELVNSKKSSLSPNIAAAMEMAVDKSKKVSVQHLQLVKRLVLTQCLHRGRMEVILILSLQRGIGAHKNGRREETKGLPGIVHTKGASHRSHDEKTGYSEWIFATTNDAIASSTSTTIFDATTTNIQCEGIRSRRWVFNRHSQPQFRSTIKLSRLQITREC